jgi:heat shock protein HslJ
MRLTLLGGAACLALALPALAAPNPGREWMLEKQSAKRTFVPDSPESNPNPGSARVKDVSISGGTNRGSSTAQQASVGETMAISGSNRTKAAGGGTRIDLGALASRLRNGPVNYGVEDKPHFQLSYDATIKTFTFFAYSNGHLTANRVSITESSPSGSKGNILIGVSRVSKDGNTVEGLFNGPEGSTGKLSSLP